MEAVVITVLICAFVSGGVLMEALAPHLPALLGLDGGVGVARRRKGVRVRGGRGNSATESEGRAHLEQRVEELRAERDFYRALVEGSASPPDGSDGPRRTGP